LQKSGNRFGTHRVLEPLTVLPQPALKLDNDFTEIFSNEILCDVTTLNIDAASFSDIKSQAKGDQVRIAEIIRDIVDRFGKLKNPRTGSGGMFIGRVAALGQNLVGNTDLKVGDTIASLVSLSLTPLRIDEINKIHMQKDQVDIRGQAVLFESGIYVKLPEDVPVSLALALMDVAGAPAQVSRLVQPGNIVAVIGARGKSGLLCCYMAKERAGATGRVIGIIHNEKGRFEVEEAPFIDDVVVGGADHAADLLKKIEQVTNGKLCDVVISCVSQFSCEMGAILITKDRGRIYFFSMATNFTNAALGAEGVGKDVDMLIGNGYCAGHAELTFGIMRKSSYLKQLYLRRYAD